MLRDGEPHGSHRSRRGAYDPRYQNLLELTEFGKSVTGDHRLQRCGYRIQRRDVSAANAIIKTPMFCGRAWLCPVCGYRAARDQFRKLEKTLTDWTIRGGSLMVLTLTQAHRSSDELDRLWDRLEIGWTAMVCGSAWVAIRELFGLRGYIRITEVVHRLRDGWHVHFHVPLLLDESLDCHAMHDLKDRMAVRFMRGIEVDGGRASWSGQDVRSVRPGSEDRVANYFSKGTELGRSATSRTPMTILSDLRDTGEGFDLWREFYLAVMGSKRKRYSPSHGLAKVVGSQS
jgi:hypothetical protein